MPWIALFIVVKTRKTKQLQHTLISVGRVSVSAIEWLSVDESDKQCVLTATHS